MLKQRSMPGLPGGKGGGGTQHYARDSDAVSDSCKVRGRCVRHRLEFPSRHSGQFAVRAHVLYVFDEALPAEMSLVTKLLPSPGRQFRR